MTGVTQRPQRPAADDLEVKFTPHRLAVAVEADGVFEGYASLFDRQDFGRDIIQPGAFRKSLRTRSARAVKMLFQHDANQPIGVWDTIREDERGLYVKGRLTLDVARARDVHSLLRTGALDGLSIGFRAVKGQRDRKSGIRRLFEIDLWEISVVTFPMHPEARIASVKAAPFSNTCPTERSFERWLTRDAGLTRREARAVLRDGFQGLQTLRDASGGTAEVRQLVEQIDSATRLLKSNL
jgi:Escherichia/Staphylococcus phage prohead protease